MGEFDPKERKRYFFSQQARKPPSPKIADDPDLSVAQFLLATYVANDKELNSISGQKRDKRPWVMSTGTVLRKMLSAAAIDQINIPKDEVKCNSCMNLSLFQSPGDYFSL